MAFRSLLDGDLPDPFRQFLSGKGIFAGDVVYLRKRPGTPDPAILRDEYHAHLAQLGGDPHSAVRALAEQYAITPARVRRLLRATGAAATEAVQP